MIIVLLVIIAMRPVQSKLHKGGLHSQKRKVVAKVYHFMKREANGVKNVTAVLKRVADATGVSG